MTPRPRRGFSLVEVLIAVAVLAMISTLIFASFAALKRSKEGVHRVSVRYREGRMAMSRISRELQSVYLSKHVPLRQELIVHRTEFHGEDNSPADRVDFTAFVNQRRDRDSAEGDQAEISYFGSEDPNQEGVVDLVRRSSPHIDEEPQTGGRIQVMATDIDLFDAKYLDPLTGQWVEEWNSTQVVRQLDRLPLQIRVHLVLNGGARSGAEEDPEPISFLTKVVLPIQRPLTFGVDG